MNARIRRSGLLITAAFVVLFGMLNWLQIVSAKELYNDPRNFRRIVRDYANPRGPIVDSEGLAVAVSVPADNQYDFLRTYPYGPLFGNVTGFYSFQFGASGIEDVFNDELTGRDPDVGAADLLGLLQGEVHTGTVQLSIDARAQELARQALAGRRGSVVVLDTRTGAVVALYQEPGFDPTVISGHDVDAAKRDDAALAASNPDPRLARSFREIYPPGSTFKIVTAAAALTFGIANPDTEFPVLTELDLPLTDRTLSNFGGSACGGSLRDSFARSCNTVFAQLGLDLNEDLVKSLQAWGIGESIPFDLRAARATRPAAGTFRDNAPLFAQAAIGQGEISVSPLQMAMIAATVANGGQMMRPYVVQRVLDVDADIVAETAPEIWRTPITADVAAIMRDLMVGVVDRGTGSAARIEGVSVAGKTGTAQVQSADPHAWFVGFAPADATLTQRQYAIAVLIENGGDLGSEATGGRLSAPVAQQVLSGLISGQLPSPTPAGGLPIPGPTPGG